MLCSVDLVFLSFFYSAYFRSFFWLVAYILLTIVVLERSI